MGGEVQLVAGAVTLELVPVTSSGNGRDKFEVARIRSATAPGTPHAVRQRRLHIASDAAQGRVRDVRHLRASLGIEVTLNRPGHEDARDSRQDSGYDDDDDRLREREAGETCGEFWGCSAHGTALGA